MPIQSDLFLFLRLFPERVVSIWSLKWSRTANTKIVSTKSPILIHITLLFLLFTLCVFRLLRGSLLLPDLYISDTCTKLLRIDYYECAPHTEEMMCVYSDFRCEVFLRRYYNTFSIILNAINVLKMPSELFSNYTECQIIKFILSIYPKIHSANAFIKCLT